MTVANVEPALLRDLEEAGLPPITGVGRWVLLELRGIRFAAAEAAGFELEQVQGVAGADFETPANRSALKALVAHVRRQRR